jgi:hypothetical protein
MPKHLGLPVLFASYFVAAQSVAGADTTVATNGLPVPRGQWLLKLSSTDLGQIQVVMNFQPQPGVRFEAHSRPGVLSQTLGGPRAFLARHFSGGNFESGALVHILQGCVESGDQTTNLHGLFVAPIIGRRVMAATLTSNRIMGDLKPATNGPTWATFEAVPYSELHPIRNYTALARDIRQATTNFIYNPSLMQSSRWKSFFNQLDHQLPLAKDDAEALFVFFAAERGLHLSHYSLTGEGFQQLQQQAPGSQYELTFPRPGVALLKIRDFAGTPEPIDSAFLQIQAAHVPTLILDLRGNKGGNLSSMSVASHLLTNETEGGIFLGSGWWSKHRSLPGAAEQAAFPVLAEYDLQTFFRFLHENGALRGLVRPRPPLFTGRVYVLTNRGTSSAAEPLVDLLKSTGRAVVIGEQTSGRMLSAESIVLPTGLTLIVPTADYYTARGMRLEGVGVAPNVATSSKSAAEMALTLAGK